LWKKLHLGVDANTGQIVASALTNQDVDDGPSLACSVAQGNCSPPPGKILLDTVTGESIHDHMWTAQPSSPCPAMI